MGVKCPKCGFENPDDTIYCGKCGTQFPSAEDIEVTETIETPKEELTRGTTLANRYEIIEELGKGGMGRVYRVEDTKLKQEVALKLIKPEIAKDKKTIERFRNELKLARNIRHKNVCGMFDLGEEKGTHYITMEYVRGEDLRSLIRRIGQLPIGKSISTAKQICEGLVEAHRLGVVHRDLKSNNIMIDKEGNVRIMDFGIARSLKAKGITGAGVMIGTPEYMSPEQVEGKDIDQRSDIYSLGIILYEMVTGRVPFEGDTPFAVGVKQKSETPQNPKEINTQIPEDLSRMILRCLEKEKEKRYQSAGEVRSELEFMEKGIPTTERRVPEPKPLTSKEITVTFSLKKLLVPALLVVLFAVSAAIIWLFLFKGKTKFVPPGKPSIAVLPFDDRSPEKNQEVLCDGLSESLINALTKIENLRVPARTSSFSFKGTKRDIQEIGEMLKVETLLEGSIQKSGDRIRVTAQLIKVEDESTLWSEVYNRELEDVFAIQDEIALAIVDSLKLQLLGSEKEELQKRYTEDVEAYNNYLQGLFYWNKRTPESFEKAIEHFQQAVERDPTFALAYVGLADCYNLQTLYSNIPPSETFPKAKQAAVKALALDDALAEAHNSLAYVKDRYDWDWAGAEQEFRRAIELNPNYATGHQWYSEFLAKQSRLDEAIGEMQKALELDPVSLIINTQLGTLYVFNRQSDQGFPILKKTIQMEPGFAHAHALLGFAYLYLDKIHESIAEVKKAIEISKGVALYKSFLGIIYAQTGKRDEAEEVIRELTALSENQFVSPYYLGCIYASLGERDKAFELFETAYDKRDENLTFIKTDPCLEHFETDPRFSIRTDPRFSKLLKKINLE